MVFTGTSWKIKSTKNLLVKHWLRTSTNIFVVVIISFGVIGLIGACWIMTSFIFWKIMLGIPVGVMFLLHRGNFVTKITTTTPFCQSRMFNRRIFDCEFQQWIIMRIMGCVCRALSGCSFDSCQCLHWDLEQLWHFICLLFNHMTFASSCLLHVEVGRLVKNWIHCLRVNFAQMYNYINIFDLTAEKFIYHAFLFSY